MNYMQTGQCEQFGVLHSALLVRAIDPLGLYLGNTLRDRNTPSHILILTPRKTILVYSDIKLYLQNSYCNFELMLSSRLTLNERSAGSPGLYRRLPELPLGVVRLVDYGQNLPTCG